MDDQINPQQQTRIEPRIVSRVLLNIVACLMVIGGLCATSLTESVGPTIVLCTGLILLAFGLLISVIVKTRPN